MCVPFILISVITRRKKSIAFLVCKYSNSSVCRTGSAVESVCGWIMRCFSTMLMTFISIQNSHEQWCENDISFMCDFFNTRSCINAVLSYVNKNYYKVLLTQCFLVTKKCNAAWRWKKGGKILLLGLLQKHFLWKESFS
jgi:hypothetical protein